MTSKSTISTHIDAPMLQILLFAGILCSIWFLEYLISDSKNNKLLRTRANLLFIFTALPVQLGLSILVVMISTWTNNQHSGLLSLIPSAKGIWMSYLLGFLILDLMDYLYHITMHKTALFWKFHQVHHCDGDVDVSTTLREHPGETFIRVSFLCLFVFISGASIGLLVVRQSIQTVSNLIAHTQLRMPLKLEFVLGFLFVTPKIHAIHHHDQLPFTDSNYGDVLSIWDRLFGTYKEMAREEISYGLDVISTVKATGFIGLIKIPFQKSKSIK